MVLQCETTVIISQQSARNFQNGQWQQQQQPAKAIEFKIFSLTALCLAFARWLDLSPLVFVCAFSFLHLCVTRPNIIQKSN
jgi:hypothetical protein